MNDPVRKVNAEKHDGNHLAASLLTIIRQLTTEIHKQRISPQRISLDSTLDRDIGLDSLAKVELLARIEKQFGVVMPERAFTDAETPRDLLRVLGCARATAKRITITEVTRTVLDEEEAAPHSAQTLIDVLKWHVQVHPDRPHIHFYSV